MRILIIAQPRTGSTVFSKWVSKELNYQWIYEPFNSHSDSKINDFLYSNNIVVKLIYQQNRGEWFYDKRIKDILHLFSLNWDFIFILTRNDLYNQSISKVWGDNNHKWHANYQIDEKWINQYAKYIKKCVIELENERNYLRSISNEQITYEGIYETQEDLKKICNWFKINEPKYISDLSIKNRYRGGEIIKNTKLI